MTAPPHLHRRLLANALRGMALGAALVLLWIGWQFARGPGETAAAPSLRVSDVQPERFKWSHAPIGPAGMSSEQAAQLKLLVLRDATGTVHAFYLPTEGGVTSVPAGSAPLSPGIPCDDFAPDFRLQEIGCHQPRAGFEFAARHRWTLYGQPLTPGTPALVAAPGGEHNGDWVWPLRGH